MIEAKEKWQREGASVWLLMDNPEKPYQKVNRFYFQVYGSMHLGVTRDEVEAVAKMMQAAPELLAERDSLKAQLALQVTHARLAHEIADDLRAKNAELLAALEKIFICFSAPNPDDENIG